MIQKLNTENRFYKLNKDVIMQLYLDSADIVEIKETFELGFLSGLTTTLTLTTNTLRHNIYV